MRINITARRFKLSEKLREFTEKEVLRLSKFYDGIIGIEVILSWEKKDRLAEINVSVFGSTLSALERSQDMFKAVTGAVEKMERQLVKYKERLHGFNHEKPVAEPSGPESQTHMEEGLHFE